MFKLTTTLFGIFVVFGLLSVIYQVGGLISPGTDTALRWLCGFIGTVVGIGFLLLSNLLGYLFLDMLGKIESDYDDEDDDYEDEKDTK